MIPTEKELKEAYKDYVNRDNNEWYVITPQEICFNEMCNKIWKHHLKNLIS